jgi:hypothetical protein
MYRPRRPVNVPPAAERTIRRRARRALSRAALVLSMAPGSVPAVAPGFRFLGEDKGHSQSSAAQRNFSASRRPRGIDLGNGNDVLVTGKLGAAHARSISPAATQLESFSATRRFAWTAPKTGFYLVEFTSLAEPPERFSLRVRGGRGVEIYQGETSAVSLQLSCEVQERIEIWVGHPAAESSPRLVRSPGDEPVTSGDWAADLRGLTAFDAALGSAAGGFQLQIQVLA